MAEERIDTQDITPDAPEERKPNGTDVVWDLNALRIDPSNQATLGAEKVITTVPISKPNKQQYVRVRDGEEWTLETAVIELKDDRETFLVAPNLVTALSEEWSAVALFYAITRHGDPFLWPIKLPSGGRSNTWNESALKAVEIAKHNWARVMPNMSLGAYDVFRAMGDIPDPEWPAFTFEEVVQLAFRGRVIDSPDHAVLRKLRGEV